MSRVLTCLCALALATASIWARPAAASNGTGRPRLAGLQPGTFEVLTHRVPIRIVFIGYEAQQLDLETFKAWLPLNYKPVVRYPQYFGLQGRDLGLLFDFSYSFEFKGKPFADKFFGAFLQKLGGRAVDRGGGGQRFPSRQLRRYRRVITADFQRHREYRRQVGVPFQEPLCFLEEARQPFPQISW